MLIRHLSYPKKDKQKTIAINELKSQTKKLENLLLLQVQPKFTIELRGSGYMNIKNIDGDCYNLKIMTEDGTYREHENPFQDWANFYSASTAKKINDSIHRDFIFIFEDRYGNKMKQILHTSKRTFSNLEVLKPQ